MFADEFGYGRSFADYREMIATVRPDVIVCVVHPTCSEAVLRDILPLGIPVFTEKPPALTVDAAAQLASLASASQTRNYVAFNRRRVPSIEFAKCWIDANGPVRYLSVQMLRHRRNEARFCLQTGIHALDTARYLAGTVVKVETERAAYDHAAGFDYRVRLRFASGAAANVAILVNAGVAHERYLVQTDDAHIEVELAGNPAGLFARASVRVYRDGQLETVRVDQSDPLSTGGFRQEHQAFLRSIVDGTAIDCTLDDAQHSVRLAAAVQYGYNGRLDERQPPCRLTA